MPKARETVAPWCRRPRSTARHRHAFPVIDVRHFRGVRSPTRGEKHTNPGIL